MNTTACLLFYIFYNTCIELNRILLQKSIQTIGHYFFCRVGISYNMINALALVERWASQLWYYQSLLPKVLQTKCEFASREYRRHLVILFVAQLSIQCLLTLTSVRWPVLLCWQYFHFNNSVRWPMPSDICRTEATMSVKGFIFRLSLLWNLYSVFALVHSVLSFTHFYFNQQIPLPVFNCCVTLNLDACIYLL